MLVWACNIPDEKRFLFNLALENFILLRMLSARNIYLCINLKELTDFCGGQWETHVSKSLKGHSFFTIRLA